MTETPTRDQNKFIVRMPDGMRDRIRDAAVANNRSMNAEIIARLEESFSADSTFPAEKSAAVLERVVTRMVMKVATSLGTEIKPLMGDTLADLSKSLAEATETPEGLRDRCIAATESGVSIETIFVEILGEHPLLHTVTYHQGNLDIRFKSPASLHLLFISETGEWTFDDRSEDADRP